MMTRKQAVRKTLGVLVPYLVIIAVGFTVGPDASTLHKVAAAVVVGLMCLVILLVAVVDAKDDC